MRTEATDRIINSLICRGYSSEQIDEIRNTIIITLKDYKIEKEATDLTIYEGDINENMIRKFAIVKRVSGRTDRTIEFYTKTLRFIFRHMQKSCLEVTTDDIRLYLAIRETRDGLSKVTLNNELRAMSTFYKWLRDDEYITKNPTLKIEKMKEPKKQKPAFSEMDIEKIRLACRAYRETAIVEILLSTGCRVTELVNIKIEEIDRDKVIVHGKGNKDRMVYLNAKAVMAIELYLAERKDDNPYLFPKGIDKMLHCGITRKGMPTWYKDPKLIDGLDHTDKSTIESIVRKIGKRAEVKEVHPHRFRRTCATMALRRGMPIEQVSKMLGHNNISTTQIYLDLNEKELEYSHRKYVV
jgi:site-specific recombinase XerD